MLKINESTAKMYLKNPEYHDFGEMGEMLKERYGLRKSKKEIWNKNTKVESSS